MPSEAADIALHRQMGLSDLEYDVILRQLGREPTLTEIGMFGVLWSEHCSYKSSRDVLRLFSNYKAAIEGSGLENAGVIEIGDGIGITFKVESHNHPSAVEPYEGAATGVGGIIRDILTMGARPIAALNSLRFGEIKDSADDRRLFGRVVQGVGGYGNCIGVPTVAGEVRFDKLYAKNPLVNAMCIGQVDVNKVATAAARIPGSPVLYLGSATGSDGIHGATFASDVLGEENEAKRPNVQIGDPFAGKLLIEATLEALQTGAIIAIQDMGAAGLTCGTCEMSAKGDVGMEINLDHVPTREPNMSAYEIMLSETQERMLAVVEFDREKEVIEVFAKWGLPATVIGFVTPEQYVVVKHHGEIAAKVPTHFITDGCPTIELTAEEPDNVRAARSFDPSSISTPKDLNKTLLTMLASPNVASKRWVYEQYDYTVQTQTALWPGDGDAAVLALRGTKKAIATKIDGDGRKVFASPYVGGQLAIIEAARNVACTGARPLAATDCLNYGDPNDPEVFFQFKESVRGIADAAEKLKIPVLSGNVSFYNTTEAGAILPTPTIGVVGCISDAENRIGMALPRGIGYIYLLFGRGPMAKQHGLGASEYLRTVHGVYDGAPEEPDLNIESGLISFLCNAAEAKLIACAHDISDGGIAVTAAEMCIAGKAGCSIIIDANEHIQRHILTPTLEKLSTGRVDLEDIPEAVFEAETSADPWRFSHRMDARLFGEMPGRVLVGVTADTVREGKMEQLFALGHDCGLTLHCIGTYDYSTHRIRIATPSSPIIDVPLEEARSAYYEAIPQIMK